MKNFYILFLYIFSCKLFQKYRKYLNVMTIHDLYKSEHKGIWTDLGIFVFFVHAEDMSEIN